MRSAVVRLVPLNPQTNRVLNQEPVSPIVIGVLGPFRVLKTGQPLALGNAGKAEALLAQLALAPGQRVARDHLLQQIWPDHDPMLAGQALNSLVYSLRKRLGEALGGVPPIVQADGLYWLNSERGVRVDSALFDDLLQLADQQTRAGQAHLATATRRRALDLYRGDLSGGSDLPIVLERERLRVAYLGLLARLAEDAYRQGAYSECLDTAWQLLARDPCREDAHRLVMQCCVRLGQRAQALRQYRLCRDILDAEFGAPPEAITTALFDQVRLAPERV